MRSPDLTIGLAGALFSHLAVGPFTANAPVETSEPAHAMDIARQKDNDRHSAGRA
jgi:hypothetical protein